MISKQRYRKWVRDRCEGLFQNNIDDKHSGKKWRTTKLDIINTFIEEYNASGFIPEYLITRNYWYRQSNRDNVIKHNKRLTNVIRDFVKPTNSKPIFIDHFMEKHKDKQRTIKDDDAKIVLVKNTLSGEYEDDVEYEIIEGSYHIHTIITGFDDDKIFYPNSKIKNAIEMVYGMDNPPLSLCKTDEGLKQIKRDLLNYEIRNRCDFLGNSKDSLDITSADEKAGYDGFAGWRGIVAYCLKDVYNVDTLLEIYDDTNSSIFPK